MLTELIKKRIAESGAIGIDEFMSIVASYYYQNKSSIGREGDFITSPEISQMFGEIIGLFCANFWLESNCPVFNLVEIGPGKGTLMKDVLRVSAKVGGYFDVMQNVYMVETSNKLIEVQKDSLEYYNKCVWVDHVDKVQKGFNIIICNEFFDALPIKQFIRRGAEFREIRVGLVDHEFRFVESNEKFYFNVNCLEGDVLELSPASRQYALSIADKLREGGLALIVDYGYLKPIFKNTLQAVRNHTYRSILIDIGEADITAHVDFTSLRDVFLQLGYEANIVTQGEFLVEYGIEFRARQLIKAGAEPREIKASLERLISPAQMGDLFKVLCVKNKVKKNGSCN